MLCEHCGKKEATFYYKTNVNGDVNEQHLCCDCAKELGYLNDMETNFAGFHQFNQKLFPDFDEFFAPMPALAGNMFEPFNRIFSDMDRMFPELGSFTEAIPERTASAPAEHQACQVRSDLVSDEEQRKLNQERRINALRCEMQNAIKTENFERAAALRDEIRGLENKG